MQAIYNYGKEAFVKKATVITMDIKAKIEELYKKITSDKDILAKFKSEPIKTVEGLLGIDLPDEQIEKLVEGIKAKIDIEEASEKISGVMGKLGGLFGKK